MRTLCFILLGGLMAGAITTVLSPNLLSWYATPPVPIGVSCDAALNWAMDKLILFQTIGLTVGAVVGAVIGFKVRSKPTPPALATPNG